MTRKSKGAGYPADWPEIARKCKDDAGWKCVRCGHPHDPKAGYSLTVHHLTMEPSQCAWWNLAALCQRCHLQIQHKVVMERVWIFEHSQWFKPYVAGYYAHMNHAPEDHEWVMANMDALILLGQGQRAGEI